MEYTSLSFKPRNALLKYGGMDGAVFPKVLDPDTEKWKINDNYYPGTYTILRITS